jgi:hypothetical protein
MTRRRLGRPAARRLAACPSLAAALTALAETPYGHDVRPGQTLAQAQRAIVDTAIWNVRVLAGWAPRDGVTCLRVLVGGVEIANVEDHLRRLAGATPPSPYRLGALATAWPRLAVTTSLDEVRAVLATSSWGDPGGTAAGQVGMAMRTCLADRTMEEVPAAAEWAAGATALLMARVAALGGQLAPPARPAASRVVGPAAVAASGLPQLITALPRVAGWALVGVDHPDDLWQAEARWWSRVERDATDLMHRALPGQALLTATVALLAVDAWRVRAALEVAARGGGPLEVFDAVA